jgi:hypothetical protein
VCLVVQSYYTRDPRVRREAEALAQAGYEVDVIGLKGQGSKWREMWAVSMCWGFPLPAQGDRLSIYARVFRLSSRWSQPYSLSSD